MNLHSPVEDNMPACSTHDEHRYPAVNGPFVALDSGSACWQDVKSEDPDLNPQPLSTPRSSDLMMYVGDSSSRNELAVLDGHETKCYGHDILPALLIPRCGGQIHDEFRSVHVEIKARRAGTATQCLSTADHITRQKVL